jgi:hypothetical protein
MRRFDLPMMLVLTAAVSMTIFGLFNSQQAEIAAASQPVNCGSPINAVSAWEACEGLLPLQLGIMAVSLIFLLSAALALGIRAVETKQERWLWSLGSIFLASIGAAIISLLIGA